MTKRPHLSSSRASTAIAAAVVALLLVPATASAQKISVKSATPSAGEQGSIDLDVVIAGSGFGNGAKAHFFLSGTENPDGILVKNTRFVSSTQLVATIDIADTASLSYFDIRVVLAGRSGKGTDLFQVIQKVTGQPGFCPPPPVDPRFQVVGTLTAPTTPTGALSISMSAGRSVLTSAGGSREVLVLGAGTTNENSSSGTFEVFFVDPVTGASLDGTSLLPGSPAQTHLSFAMPAGTAAGQQAAGDVNGDGVTDFIVTGHNGMSNTARLFLGQQDSMGVVSYQAMAVPHPADDIRFGVGVAIGDLTGDGRDEFVVTDGYACCSGGKQARRPSFYVYSAVTGSPVILQRIVPTDGVVTALTDYGHQLAIGDVSGDGINDIVVTNASWGDGKLPSAGALMVHHGTGAGPTWLSPSAVVLLDASPLRDEQFGAGVLVGNLTASGSGALDAVGIARTSPVAELFRGPLLATGQAPDSQLRLPAITFWRRGWSTRPGATVDLNADGLTDIVFGAPHAPDDITCDPMGAVQVFLARGSLLTGTTGWDAFVLTAPVPAHSAAFGWAVAAAPGSRLLFVGEKGRDVEGRAGAGQIYVYRVIP
jgi:hypothetical protein